MVSNYIFCGCLVWLFISWVCPMNRPEGLLLAVQQHIHFSALLAENLGLTTQQVLDGLSKSGMRLATDEADVGLDAAKVYPNLMNMKAKLQVVE